MTQKTPNQGSQVGFSEEISTRVIDLNIQAVRTKQNCDQKIEICPEKGNYGVYHDTKYLIK